MRTLVVLHRWLGVTFCLLFAMWFATGIVMHFVPFPALTEAERIAGLAPIELASVRRGPVDAVLASKLKQTERLRLWQRSDGPVYLVSASSGVKAMHAADLSPANIQSERLALAVAIDHARARGFDVARAALVELADYDQWTVPNGLDLHRPLYRVALNDSAGTEIYVSSTTGEVVRDTTRQERLGNYAGSVVHWIYPTFLRKDWRLWNETVWWLSLIAMFATVSGMVVGTARLRFARNRPLSPYRGWHAWHHWLGLSCMVFVLTWILSGWLSMDHGRLFSEGKVTDVEATQIVGSPAWEKLSAFDVSRVPAPVKEIEWFALGGQVYQRERTALNIQRLFAANSGRAGSEREFLQPDELSRVMQGVATDCGAATVVEPGDHYALASAMPHAPVYRSICGNTWFHIDGATGEILDKIDGSRRAYRWVYSALHTFDLPALMARPNLRTALIMTLCGFGLAFSVTGIVIGWRRLRLQFWNTAYPRR